MARVKAKRAKQKAKKPAIVTILHFADHHQDFLRWHLDANGAVVKSEPFQTRIWKGTRVTNHKALKRGSLVWIDTKHTGYRTTLNYRCKKVEHLKEVSNG